MLVPPAKDIKKSFKRKNKKIMPCLCKLNYELLKSIKNSEILQLLLVQPFLFPFFEKKKDGKENQKTQFLFHFMSE